MLRKLSIRTFSLLFGPSYGSEISIDFFGTIICMKIPPFGIAKDEFEFRVNSLSNEFVLTTVCLMEIHAVCVLHSSILIENIHSTIQDGDGSLDMIEKSLGYERLGRHSTSPVEFSSVKLKEYSITRSFGRHKEDIIVGSETVQRSQHPKCCQQRMPPQETRTFPSGKT